MSKLHVRMISDQADVTDPADRDIEFCFHAHVHLPARTLADALLAIAEHLTETAQGKRNGDDPTIFTAGRMTVSAVVDAHDTKGLH